MAADAFDQEWTVGRREATRIVLTGTADPAGGTYSARLAARPGGTPLLADVSVTAGGSDPDFTLTVALTAAHTDRAAGRYRLEVWRTDAGEEQRRAAGDLVIVPTIPAA